MTKKRKYSPEMRLFDTSGHRLYLNEEERGRFLDAAKTESRENRVFCHILYYTGCRPTEVLELTPARIQLKENVIVIRNLKKREFDQQGRRKLPSYRAIPVPERLTEDIDLVFDLRKKQKDKILKETPLFPMSRQSAWRIVKIVMDNADIEGPQATSKGLRHGFGIACVMAGMPLHKIRDWLGHSDTKTTEIYTTVIQDEDRKLLMRVWDVL